MHACNQRRQTGDSGSPTQQEVERGINTQGCVRTCMNERGIVVDEKMSVLTAVRVTTNEEG